MIRFFVPGTPVPKQSFKYTKNGGGYTPERVTNWRDSVMWVAKGQMQYNDFLTGNISVELRFYVPTKRRVDLDNLSKNVLDALNGICYKDDSQVVRLLITKDLSKADPGVLIQMEEDYGS